MDDRIVNRKLQILRGLACESSHPIEGWRFRTADFAAPQEYRFDGPWAGASLPAKFRAGKTVFLKARANVPASASPADTYLTFGMADMEGMLSIDGQPYAGMDFAHTRIPIPRTGRMEIAAEFISVPTSYHMPEHASKMGEFHGISIATVDRGIEALYYDVRFAWETAHTLADTRRKALLDDAVEAALLAVDLTLPRPRLRKEVANASRTLKRKLAAIAPDPEAGGIYAVGHTHIDTAWLWPLRETVRKCGRTFSTACRLMERYPEFRFACSQAQLYRYVQRHYPALYREIRKWVKTGRWETAGAMWVEADCNATGGESLVRQMLYGLDFFRREFGTRPRMC